MKTKVNLNCGELIKAQQQLVHSLRKKTFAKKWLQENIDFTSQDKYTGKYKHIT